jgi:hypothetical protein
MRAFDPGSTGMPNTLDHLYYILALEISRRLRSNKLQCDYLYTACQESRGFQLRFYLGDNSPVTLLPLISK